MFGTTDEITSNKFDFLGSSFFIGGFLFVITISGNCVTSPEFKYSGELAISIESFTNLWNGPNNSSVAKSLIIFNLSSLVLAFDNWYFTSSASCPE